MDLAHPAGGRTGDEDSRRASRVQERPLRRRGRPNATPSVSSNAARTPLAVKKSAAGGSGSRHVAARTAPISSAPT